MCRTHFALFELGTQSLVSNLIWHYLHYGAINAYIKCLISFQLYCAAHYMLFFYAALALVANMNAINIFKLVKSAPNAFIIKNNKFTFSLSSNRAHFDFKVTHWWMLICFYEKDLQIRRQWDQNLTAIHHSLQHAHLICSFISNAFRI